MVNLLRTDPVSENFAINSPSFTEGRPREPKVYLIMYRVGLNGGQLKSIDLIFKGLETSKGRNKTCRQLVPYSRHTVDKRTTEL